MVHTMSNGMVPLKDVPQFEAFMLSLHHNPILGVLVGFFLTAIVQSSSATIGILQALALQGLVPLEAALPILFGDNIGTCVTALLAGIGTSITAKRTAILHLVFNTIGTLVFLVLLKPITSLVILTSLEEVRQIANAHTLFNIANTIIQLPFAGMLVILVTKLVPGEDEEDLAKLVFLDKRILETPAVAVVQIVKEILRMGSIARANVRRSIYAILNEDENLIEEVYKRKESKLERSIMKFMKFPTRHNVEQTNKVLSN